MTGRSRRARYSGASSSRAASLRVFSTRVVAEDLPGPGSVFLGVEWKFVKAVGIGEEIVARAEVLSVREDKPICTLATSVANAAGEICLSGTATTYTVPLD